MQTFPAIGKFLGQLTFNYELAHFHDLCDYRFGVDGNDYIADGIASAYAETLATAHNTLAPLIGEEAYTLIKSASRAEAIREMDEIYGSDWRELIDEEDLS